MHEMRRAYNIRGVITSLFIVDTNDEYTLNKNGVLEIQFSAGTSGHEYNVIYKDKVIQLRGLKFIAEWSLR